MLLVSGKIHNIQRKKTDDSANITKANEKNVRLKKETLMVILVFYSLWAILNFK